MGSISAIIEAGEMFSQKIKESNMTFQIEQVLSKAYEHIDNLKSQT